MNDQPSVELPGVTPEDGVRASVVRNAGKGANQSPLRPFLIMGAVVLLMLVIVGAMWVQGMKPKVRESARTAPVAAQIQNTGLAATQEPSPMYRELVAEENRRAVEDAKDGSVRAVVPPLIGDRDASEDPEPVVTFEDAPAPVRPAGSSRPQRPAVDPKRVQAMAAESAKLRSGWATLHGHESNDGAPLLVAGSSEAPGPEAGLVVPPTQPPLFSVQSAVFVTGANSDYPAPVVLAVTGGPLRGARVLADFRSSSSQGGGDRIQLRVTRVELGGQVFAADGLAVDPSTHIPAIEGDINRHLTRNILARGSVAFLLGYAGGLTTGARTSFADDGGFVTSSVRTGDLFRAEAAREAASAASEIRIRQPTVTIPAGTAVGIVFLDRLKVESAAGDGEGGRFVAGAHPLTAADAQDPFGVSPLEFSTADE